MANLHGRDQSCPKCGSFDVIKDDDGMNMFECLDCGHFFHGNITKEMKEIEIKRKQRIRDAKRKTKNDLIQRYKNLKKLIYDSYEITCVEKKHMVFSDIDDEFAVLCPKKFNSYTPLGIFQNNLDNDYYFQYLNNRLTKMIKDIDRILFYFDK